MAGKRSSIEFGRLQQSYLNALLAGDRGAAGRIVNEVISQRGRLGDIYFQVLAPAMVEIGELWCKGKVNVAQEHLGTQITLDQMDKLRLLHDVSPTLPYRALVACVEGEQHFMAARMSADLYQMEGWLVDFLGPDVPSRALMEMVAARRPNLLALSATLAANLRRARILIKKLMQLADPPAVILGVPVALGKRARQENIQGAVVTTSVIEGLNLAKKLLQPQSPRAVLADYLKELGRRIRDLRKRAGWTQEQLAQATRLTRVYIVAVESGKQNVSMDVIVRLANGLEVLPERLLTIEERPVGAIRKSD